MQIRRARSDEAGVVGDLYWRAREAAVPAIPPSVHPHDDATLRCGRDGHVENRRSPADGVVDNSSHRDILSSGVRPVADQPAM